MSEFSHLRNKLLAEQVEDQIYHYILDTPIEPGAKLPSLMTTRTGLKRFLKEMQSWNRR